MALNDGDLLSEFILGRSDSAFRALQERYAGLVFSICRKQLHDRQLAEDAKQTVFMILSQQASHLQPGLLKGYLAETSRRVAASHARSQRRRRDHESCASVALQLLQPHPSNLSGRQLLLQRGLAEIRTEDRELLELRYFGDAKTTRQLAIHLGITHAATKQRLARAIRDLRRRVQFLNAEDGSEEALQDLHRLP